MQQLRFSQPASKRHWEIEEESKSIPLDLSLSTLVFRLYLTSTLTLHLREEVIHFTRSLKYSYETRKARLQWSTLGRFQLKKDSLPVSTCIVLDVHLVSDHSEAAGWEAVLACCRVCHLHHLGGQCSPGGPCSPLLPGDQLQSVRLALCTVD